MTAPDTLPRELAELGELLREDPPRPDPGWARELDARAAAGFPRPPRRMRRPRLLRSGVLLPALGFAASLILVVGVVGLATMDKGGDDEGGGGGESAVQSSGGSESAGEPTAGSEEPAIGSGDSADAGGDSAQSLAPRPRSVPPSPGGGDPGSDRRRDRREERSAALTLAAPPREIDTVADGVIRVTDAVGGYVASSSVASGDDGSGAGTFDLRVPTARLPRALAELSRLANVRERSQATRDITAQSVSARDRLDELRREREGLLRALARATTLNETESIRARLRSVNRQIGSARTSVRRLQNRANFANVAVTLVADGGAGAGAGDGTWTPGDALKDAVRVLEVAAGVALIALAIALPLAVVGGLALLAARGAGRRRRERALDMA